MAFPSYAPTNRTVDLGDYPVKKVMMLSGAETRLRYGNQRSRGVCTLQYDKMTPAQCQAFINHYDSVGGSSKTFAVTTAITAGWNASGIAGSGQWRYDAPPEFRAVAGECDKSTITIKLMSVV